MCFIVISIASNVYNTIASVLAHNVICMYNCVFFFHFLRFSDIDVFLYGFICYGYYNDYCHGIVFLLEYMCALEIMAVTLRF